ncbi:alpha/beta hydrolase [Chelativorans salis]|uniref:Alpha/beta hydrolase n=1 Tax=Chelativorans salis TaxID=2978478 RepID=A0ABT2LV92_9HYPH|nr:alpha/beta hydrolase [Chelativorans sp. EGI FJ00035]MCT7378452.1 alpha/beta hydrolase [Chelativorans sp. EGI FJ00035]
MPLRLDPADLAEARHLNRKLAWMPKFRPRGRIKAFLMQGVMRAQQLRPQPYLQRLDVRVEMREVVFDGGRILVRILRPNTRPKGIYLDIHGGAWIVGNARCDDPCNAMIAAECGMAVVSVEYRLALDNRLDLCIEDCRKVAFWLVENCMSEFGTDRIVIGGESAGAHLAACALLALRDAGQASRLAGAVLFYGAYDLSGSPSLRAAGPETLVLHGPSAFRNLKRLTADRSDVERRRPDISPLYADLAGLPPALFLVGALDPLLDDTLQMAERWNAANGNAELTVVPEAPHAFNRLKTSIAVKTNAYVRRWVNRRLEMLTTIRTDKVA